MTHNQVQGKARQGKARQGKARQGKIHYSKVDIPLKNKGLK
ncbi:hypothetical protein ALTER154_80745 [Alteromonas sp. 154]|nr:hypothetical protein ALTER154_80745 [Alteromonas sp. 154]